MTVQDLIKKYRIEDGRLRGEPGTLIIPNGKNLKPSEIEELRSRKNEILAELKLQAEAAERRRAEEAAAQAQRMAQIESEIFAGTRKVRLEWREGEYLSGYQIAGTIEETQVVEKVLANLGIGKDIEGWGFLVDSKVADAVGTEFTYEQVKAFCQPRLDAEAKKRAEAEAARAAKFDEARKTGKPVELRRHSENCDGSVVECSLDIVIEYALPDGSIKVERIHTF